MIHLLLAALCLTLPLSAARMEPAEVNTWKNNLPPRYQWNHNSGYCGEVSLISAGLYYGQYLSQYDARAIATDRPQNKGQLLLGQNDLKAAERMHLTAIAWDTAAEQETSQFLAWVKQQVFSGYPVAIGIYTNEYLFYGKTNPSAGDSEYDHIVPVTGIGSNHSLTDPAYYSDDLIYFSDNGLWGNASNPPYHFSYAFGAFQTDRKGANSKKGPIYSLSDSGSNYGIALTGIMDLDGDTLPIRITTSVNNESPQIKDKSNTRPAPMPITLTVTVSDLQPNTVYNLYRYNSLNSIPDSQFNAHASQAVEHWPIQITAGNQYVMTQGIQSDEIAAYRCVKASAP